MIHKKEMDKQYQSSAHGCKYGAKERKKEREDGGERSETKRPCGADGEICCTAQLQCVHIKKKKGFTINTHYASSSSAASFVRLMCSSYCIPL